jgi:hypothetical protein
VSKQRNGAGDRKRKKGRGKREEQSLLATRKRISAILV